MVYQKNIQMLHEQVQRYNTKYSKADLDFILVRANQNLNSNQISQRELKEFKFILMRSFNDSYLDSSEATLLFAEIQQ